MSDSNEPILAPWVEAALRRVAPHTTPESETPSPIATPEDLRTVAQHWRSMSASMTSKHWKEVFDQAERIFALADLLESIPRFSKLPAALAVLDSFYTRTPDEARSPRERAGFEVFKAVELLFPELMASLRPPEDG